jgi:hypothetical protein
MRLGLSAARVPRLHLLAQALLTVIDWRSLCNSTTKQLIETLFRNGTVTVVGIVLSFSLSFLTQWANNPLPWTLKDVPTVVLIALGIVFQMISLHALLKLSSLKEGAYNKANRIFMIGVAITGSGIVAAIIIDTVKLVGR